MLDMHNNEHKTKIPAHMHVVLAIAVTLYGIELYWLQFLRVEGEVIYDLLYGPMAILTLPLMAYPIYIFFGRPVKKKYASLVNKRPFFIRVEQNKIKAALLDSETPNVLNVAGNFSNKSELIADAKPLTQALCEAFKESFSGVYTAPAPYVIVSTSQELSPIQAQALNAALKNAGAGHVTFINGDASLEDAKRFAKENPYR